MPHIDLAQYELIPPPELESRRRAIVEKSGGNHENLTIEELHELAAITGVLRRKASGPPKTAKGAKPKKEKPAAVTLDDLA